MTQKINKLTEAEKGYFAGLFDGEGCVSINKAKQKSNNYTYILNVSFNITYAQILYKMKCIFDGTVYESTPEKVKNTPSAIKSKSAGCVNPDNWKTSYRYFLYGKDAWIFLKVIYPYCNEKKEQVRTAIEYFNGKRERTISSKHEIERNEYYRNSLQKLKKNDLSIKSYEDDFNDQTKLSIFSEQ